MSYKCYLLFSLVLTVVKHSYPINLQSNMGPVVCPIYLLKCYSPKCSYWPYVSGKLAFRHSQQINSSCTLPTKSPSPLSYVLEIPSPFYSIYLHATKENVFMHRNICLIIILKNIRKKVTLIFGYVCRRILFGYIKSSN